MMLTFINLNINNLNKYILNIIFNLNIKSLYSFYTVYKHFNFLKLLIISIVTCKLIILSEVLKLNVLKCKKLLKDDTTLIAQLL